MCQPGLSCELGLPGTCIAEKSPGDTCKISVPDACPSDYYCSVAWWNGGGQCLRLPVEGQLCADTYMPSVGLTARCSKGTTCVNGICKPWSNLTEACEVHEQCYSGYCQGDLDAGTGICAPPVCP